MNKHVGVWIDHKKAVIVRLDEDVEMIHTIMSEIEKHVRYTGGVPEDQIEHRFSNHLKEYYDKVITFIQGAESILILGPGEAKSEFEKQLISKMPEIHVKGIEVEDKMTDRQIAEHVKEYFLNPVEEQLSTHKH